MAAATTIIAGVGLAFSFQQSRQQAKQQKKAANAARKQEEIRSTQARKQAIREAAVRRAQIVANSSAAGLQSSSGAMGGIGAIGSTLAGNYGAAQMMSQQSQLQAIATTKANQFGSNAQMFGDIAGFANSGQLANVWGTAPGANDFGQMTRGSGVQGFIGRNF